MYWEGSIWIFRSFKAIASKYKGMGSFQRIFAGLNAASKQIKIIDATNTGKHLSITFLDRLCFELNMRIKIDFPLFDSSIKKLIESKHIPPLLIEQVLKTFGHDLTAEQGRKNLFSAFIEVISINYFGYVYHNYFMKN